jgi:hypothetical protein
MYKLTITHVSFGRVEAMGDDIASLPVRGYREGLRNFTDGEPQRLLDLRFSHWEHKDGTSHRFYAIEKNLEKQLTALRPCGKVECNKRGRNDESVLSVAVDGF